MSDDAPKRIWAAPDHGDWGFDSGEWDTRPDHLPAHRLRYILATPEALSDAPEVQALIAAAVEAVIEAFDNPPRASATSLRDDGVWSKNDQCEHGAPHFEDCHQCSMNAARAAAIRAGKE